MSGFSERLARILAEVQASPAAHQDLEALLLEARELEREATWLRGLAVATSKLAEIGRAAAAQNHQLRQPVLAVQALAGFVEEVADKPEQVRVHAEQIREQADRMSRMLAQLGGVTFRASEGDSSRLADVARSVASLIAYRLGRRIVLELEVPSDLPLVRGTPDLLEQILLNLVTNALDAVEERGTGGGVVVRARGGEQPLTVELYVADEGTGVRPELRARLFDGFFTTKEAGRGTGLGLLICRGLARAAGGTVELCDAEQAARLAPWPMPVRTLFRVVLPVAEPAPES